MTLKNTTGIDITYDNKVAGNLIDPYEWNDNFQKIETNINENVAKLNENFTLLAGEDGAAQIGISDYTGSTDVLSSVDAQILLIASKIINMYSKTQIDNLINSGKANTVSSIAYNSDDGVFTITKLDGNSYTIDTNIEKIPVSVELEEDSTSGKVYLKITNYDGSFTKADVSSLLNVYTVSDTTTIDMTLLDGVISSAIKNGSITSDHLASGLLDTIEAYKTACLSAATSAQNSANAAATSAEESASSAEEAGRFELTARASSKSAEDGANYAQQSARDANTYASNAEDYMFASKSWAVGGTNTRDGEDTNNAKYFAEHAEEISAHVDESATSAATAASTAAEKATIATSSATVATEKASAASVSADSAEAAKTSAESASETALQSAESASTYADSAEDYATTSKSWAVGETGTRENEDTNNAKYWAQQAQSAAGGDFAPTNSPVFTGTPKAPTPTAVSEDTQIATKGYVDNTAAPIILYTSVTAYTMDVLSGYIDSGRPLYICENNGAFHYPVLLSMIQKPYIIKFFYMRADTRKIKIAQINFRESAWDVYDLDTLVGLDSPTFTGTPTAPEPTETSSSTQIATKGYVDSNISGVSPVILDRAKTYTEQEMENLCVTTNVLFISIGAKPYPIVSKEKRYPSDTVTIYSFYFLYVDNESQRFGRIEYNLTTMEWGDLEIDFCRLASEQSPAFIGTPTAPTPTSSSAATQIATKGYVDNATAGSNKVLTFKNVQVDTQGNVSAPINSGYDDYPWEIYIPLTGVNTNYSPDVRFSPGDVVKGLFAPFSTSVDTGINIYATDDIATEGIITIPAIICTLIEG